MTPELALSTTHWSPFDVSPSSVDYWYVQRTYIIRLVRRKLSQTARLVSSKLHTGPAKKGPPLRQWPHRIRASEVHVPVSKCTVKREFISPCQHKDIDGSRHVRYIRHIVGLALSRTIDIGFT